MNLDSIMWVVHRIGYLLLGWQLLKQLFNNTVQFSPVTAARLLLSWNQIRRHCTRLDTGKCSGFVNGTCRTILQSIKRAASIDNVCRNTAWSRRYKNYDVCFHVLQSNHISLTEISKFLTAILHTHVYWHTAVVTSRHSDRLGRWQSTSMSPIIKSWKGWR
jgi:hypothetical protein